MPRFDEIDFVIDNSGRQPKVFVSDDSGNVFCLNRIEVSMGDVLPCSGVEFLFSGHQFNPHDPVVDIMFQFASANPDACMGVVAD